MSGTEASLLFLGRVTKEYKGIPCVHAPRRGRIPPHTPPHTPGPPLCTPGPQCGHLQSSPWLPLTPYCPCVTKGFSRLREATWLFLHFPIIFITKTRISREAAYLSRRRRDAYAQSERLLALPSVRASGRLTVWLILLSHWGCRHSP